METTTFDQQKYKSFKAEYGKAVQGQKTEFDFEGNTFVTGYAKYVLEYLSQKFEQKK